MWLASTLGGSPRRPELVASNARLRDLLHVGGVSISGLAKILSRVADAPVTEHSERQLQAANLELFGRQRKVITVPLHDGGNFEWEVVDFTKTLPVPPSKSEGLRSLYAAAAVSSPPSATRPWSAVVAFDEFCPGNKLQAADGTPSDCYCSVAPPLRSCEQKGGCTASCFVATVLRQQQAWSGSPQVDNRRKVMVVSVAIKELGQSALSKNDTWLTLAVARTHGVMDRVAGGWSAMLRLLVEDLFLGPLGLRTVGLPLTLPTGPIVLFASLTNVLADGDGLRLAYDWRGSSSLKPCLVHHNCLKKARLIISIVEVGAARHRSQPS